MTFKESVKSCILLVIIFFVLYVGYLYIQPKEKPTAAIIEKQNPILIQPLSTTEIKTIKENFNKINNSFENRVIHTKDGIIIERIR
jgi:hypothetical protein